MSALKRVREGQHLTQEELSSNSGISVRTIQRIESGVLPKGHTLKALAKALQVSENDLLGNPDVNEDTVFVSTTADTNAVDSDNTLTHIDIPKVKLINLSSILFVLLPPLNIITPLVLSRLLKQNNTIAKQIISLQILWTILAPIVFILGILLKLGSSFTIVLIACIALSNVLLILINLAELDRNKRLHFKLNFSII
ncbi:helix-turn-helix domain-containing protein [Flavobacterium sp. RNTU_13]|uniref:helix-turn-helix domain-containing protein n=1 Tax=Flavobacterium sp. RNTU_13 TaxID=3375145 RepID=UPI00398730FA